MDDAAARNTALARIRTLKTGDTLAARPAAATFSDELFGRLTEICAPAASAALTATMGLVREMQQQGEPAIWITPKESLFFPPDASALGVCLAALTILRVPGDALLTAADKATRSGAFGLVVTDFCAFGPRGRPPSTKDAALSRLLGLAQKHDVAVVFLTRKSDNIALGSLISLRLEAGRTGVTAPSDTREVTLRVTKDKRRPPGRRFQEQCHGPAGMC